MKIKHFLFILVTILKLGTANAQTADDILKVLIQKGLVKQKEADSIRADYAFNQQAKPKDKIFQVDLQIKNRFEYRDGYGNIPTSSSIPAAFVNQRSRLNFSYQQANSLNAFLSLQDARIWGSRDPRGLDGTIQLFEAYIEPTITPNFSIRIGRQRIAIDNQRLFAENEWRVNGNTYDAINFKYNKGKLISELIGSFNQTAERQSGTDFTPTQLSLTPGNATPSTWSSYKALAVNYAKYEFTPKFTGTTIVAADGYQSKTDTEKILWRLTYGGRLEYTQGNWYTTTSGYLQSGRNTTDKTIKAWYLQPEIKYTIPKSLTIRLGAEILSGDRGTVETVDHNFVPLYGVAHRFNGFMDFFIKFPTDLNNSGLTNPYLFISKTISPKLEISSNSHLFYTQKTAVTATNQELTKYMGYEHDLMLSYKPNSYTHIETGFSFALPTETMTAIKKSGDATKIPNWVYVQAKFTPKLFKTAFN
ncbi:alginate export family protein [Flavobacterium sp. NG2]|uniref:alginate export family protein n=1 Tax=Flavobacterium sp. NG2 TaxID=3097547 RepID=UPI002A7F16F1|nr:alginate export family protein [Flavobacterium sp. NG2]WPR72790.1 alginate export family protein [Flavobacterium sp. NG2]